MATQKQKKVARLIVENTVIDKPLNGGQMLAKVGYSKSMQTAKVNDVLDSQGVRDELEILGFTTSNAKKVVSEIMLNEKVDPNARLKATDQVFKVNKEYSDAPLGNTFIQPVVVVFGQDDPLSRQLKQNVKKD